MEPVMSNKFTRGSDLFAYECIMQQLPMVSSIDKEEKKIKGRYFSILYRFMNDNGLSYIYKRVFYTLKEFVFDNIPFKNEEHRNMFYATYCRYMKLNKRNMDNTKIAVIYLLSTSRLLSSVLESYILNPLYSFDGGIKESTSEEAYNLYQAAKKLCGLKSGLDNEDLIDKEIIEDKTVCIIVNAMYIKEYGLSDGYNLKKTIQKPRYINNSKLKHNMYCYKSQTVKIK